MERRVDFENAVKGLDCRGLVKCAPARQHLKQHGAEGEDIGPSVDGFATNLLRRHVANGPEHHARYRQRGVRDLSGR